MEVKVETHLLGVRVYVSAPLKQAVEECCNIRRSCEAVMGRDMAFGALLDVAPETADPLLCL